MLVTARRTALGLACALALLLLPAAASQATTRTVTVTSTGAASGIVANNPVWAQRAIVWSVSLAGIPSTSRMSTQVLVSGTWRSVPTTSVSRTTTAARGSFYPRLGLKYYRVVAVSPTGGLVAASRAWKATGFATVPLRRVVDVAPPAATGTLTSRGLTFPALWHTTGTSLHMPNTPHDVTVSPGRCRTYLIASAVSYAGNPGEVGRAAVVGSWKMLVNTYVLDGMLVEATSPPGQQPAGTYPSTLFQPDPAVGFGLSFSSWATNPFQAVWVSGEAWGGGVGLCSAVLR